MNVFANQKPTASKSAAVEPWQHTLELSRAQVMRFGWFSAALLLVFAKPLFDWVRLAVKQDLHSHVILIPFISAYLIWTKAKELKRDDLKRNRQGLEANQGRRATSDDRGATSPPGHRPARKDVGLPGESNAHETRIGKIIGGLLGVIALSLAGAYWVAVGRGWKPSPVDAVSLWTATWVLLTVAGATWIFGVRFARTHAFALAFLAFAIPLPSPVVEGLSLFLQQASAEVSAWAFWLTGTSVFRTGQVFQMPGLTIVVAEECSGIRSTFVLLITSLLAGHLFLRNAWRRLLLVGAVIPLGILRNAFRILTISLLTMHVDPGIINSPLHHRGGPIFFLLSLVPFFLLLVWLQKQDRRATANSSPTDST